MTSNAAHIRTPAPPTKASALKRLAAIVIPEVADLVLVGDSLAAGWPADLLATARPGRHVLNLGLPGDRIQNTLWRLDHGRLGHLRPREVLVILGTNNLTDGDEPAAIAGGLAALLDRLDALFDRPAVLLATIPPRGAGPAAREAERHQLNGLIARMESDRLRLLRTERVLAEAGPEAFEEDRLHLARRGYEHLTAALVDLGERR